MALAQEKAWNDALDRYEYICRRCDEWKKRLEHNESVPRDSLESMLSELSILKKSLQWTFGNMTPGQKRRYEGIRLQYVGGESPFEPQPVLEEGNPLPSAVRVPGAILVRSLNYVSKPKVRPRTIAGAYMGVYPDLSYGVFAGGVWNHWGFLLKARSNFRFTRAAYDCLSDGSTDGGYIWTDGTALVKRHQFTADLVYMPVWQVSVCAGIGYGSRTLLWRDIDGKWARVKDRSRSGAALDIGFLVRPFPWPGWRNLTLHAGASWLPVRYIDAELGLGWTF